jgi:hypothetical protein
MPFLARTCRVLLGFIIGLSLSESLANFVPNNAPWLEPAGWSIASRGLFEEVTSILLGLILGLLVAFVLTRGEPLPVWPVMAYAAGVALYAYHALVFVQPAGGSAVASDYVWWALINFAPAASAIVFLLLTRRLRLAE